MYQTVGHDAIHFYAECMDLPLYRREILGSSILLTPDYVVTRDDETEDLLCLLQDVMVRNFKHFSMLNNLKLTKALERTS